MNFIFDSHAHFDNSRFDADRDELLASLPEKGVIRVINAAADMSSAEMSCELADRYDYIYAAVGVHPHSAKDWDESYLSRLRKLAENPKVVAVGEMGLDYHYDYSPRDVQREVFEHQLRLARELELPVIIHDREAHGDMYDILRRYAPLRGVMHCFSGSVELAEDTLRIGLHIGLGGAVTFKNARTPVEVAAMVPEDRLLLETDAPYMTPVPYRSKRNDSSYISLVAEKIAEVRGCDAQQLLIRTAHNASSLFGVPLE